jgi:hypothetical protein
VVLERLVQRVQRQRERVLLAGGQRSAQGDVEFRLRDPRRVEQVLAVYELGQRRPCSDTRGAAVDLIADVFDDVVLNADREARDVAARGVARLAR